MDDALVGFVVGVSGLLLSIILYYMGQKQIEPIYQVSKEHYLIRVSSKLLMAANDLKIVWKGKEIEEAYYSNIYFWNNGYEYIDKSRFSESDPIRISYYGNIEIIGFSLLGQSREKLGMSLDINKEKKEIYISYDGGEALEKNDGGVALIIYTGTDTPGFRINGRVKGSRSGFLKVNDFEMNSRRPDKYFNYFFLAMLIVLAPIMFFAARTNVDLYSRGDSKFIFYGRKCLFYAGFLIVFIFLITYIYILFFSPSTPAWMEPFK